ncbi:carboxylesterase type B [Polynucleobacter sphagniphilus]|uniref:carboxylesterase family protein n=1 Tax=Polynucleobacter sphagniphilus TaxID=1743169 RepID=UPI0024771A20|nr:carboxylesterase family protein [Polynucleobacter sphagniphilus]MDH6155473.1 carboxylesterase type B [Polynucleobacter sphagniphilus]MDH6420336.1 carboxylesterase type B [Polynucleobacter sphagniphilus]
MDPSAFYKGEFGSSFVDCQIIPGDPPPLFAAHKQAQVPFIIGTNSWDSSFLVPGQPPVDVLLKKLHEDPKTIAKLYAKVKDRCILSSDIQGDMIYRASTKMLAGSMKGIAPAYAYYFDYLSKNIRVSHPGAAHTFEIPYVFGSLALMPQTPSQPESGADQCGLIAHATADLKKGIWSTYWYPSMGKNSPQDQAMSEKLLKAGRHLQKLVIPVWMDKLIGQSTI